MDFLNDLRIYLSFLSHYTAEKLWITGLNFEKVKKIIVALLIIKRGKYSQSILNTSFLLIVGAALIGGPVIADNNPFIASLGHQGANSQDLLVAYSPYEQSVGTVVSAKPRNQIVDYRVRSGDTLKSIAAKFDISVNTIKWENKLASNRIKPGQVLKIPPVTGVVHKVKLGDNIYKIAKKYGVDPQAIINFPFNDFQDLDTFSLKVGQFIYVPDGVIENKSRPLLARGRAGRTPIRAGVKGNSNFIWPTSGVITQRASWYHMAIDIANRRAPPVIAADSGNIIYAGCIRYGYGCHVVIDHNNGYKTLYAHLQKIYVKVGQAVRQGQQLGQMGSTGRSTGTHLHFEIRFHNVKLNPLEFLK